MVEPVESPVSHGGVDRVAAAIRPARGWIAGLDDAGDLDPYPARVAAVAGELTDAGEDALGTCRALGGLHDALTVRLIELAEAELGAPPCPYAWLALGSAGRMEQSLRTDQDNAIVYAEGGAAAEEYFGALGVHVVDGLARAGLLRCPGGYMADRWSMPLARWREVFRGWVERPEPQALIEAEVFLDFRWVYGELSAAPLETILRLGRAAPRFLVGMARAAVRFPPPLGWAGQIRGDHDEVDLKRAGLAAVVLLARLYALAAGSRARATPQRLAEAAQARTLSRTGADELADGYRLLADLRLAAQLRQLAAGEEPTNRIRMSEMTAQERGRLRRALHTVHDLQRATALRFHTQTVL